MNILAFDLGGSSMKAGVVDENFNVTRKTKYVLEGVSHESRRETGDIILTGIQSAEAFADAVRKIRENITIPLDGAAFSYNCPVNHITGDTYFGGITQRFLNFQNFPSLFKDRLDLPVSVAKDSNCMLLAEAEAGCLKGMKNALAIGIGSGIACGILINGEIYLGAHGYSGEVSAVRLSSFPAPYSLPADTGMWGLFNRIAAACHTKPEDLNGYEAFRLIRSGDPDAAGAFKEYVQALAVMLCNFNLIFDSDAIAVGGGIARDPLLVESVRAEIEKMKSASSMIARYPDVRRCQFFDDANLIGAAIAFRKYVQKK